MMKREAVVRRVALLALPLAMSAGTCGPDPSVPEPGASAVR